MSSTDVLREVMDTSELDVPVRGVPKDISSKQEKKILRRNQNAARHAVAGKDRGTFYSPNHMIDSMYSPTHFRDDPYADDDPYDGDDSFLAEQQETMISNNEEGNPANVLNRMYSKFAACVSVVTVPPQRAVSVLMEENELWDFNDAETADFDEEREQMQRLTSWSTMETTGTVFTQVSERDRGLLALRKRSRPQSSARKRAVQFDYPIISSLKECPRPDPRDLPKLYFTEEELGQIEDDRESTYTADDVEVVCVSSSQSTEAEDNSSLSNSKSMTNVRDPSMSSYRTTSKLSKSTNEPSAADPTRSPTPPLETGKKRQIKSVQIYLRERSRA